MYEDEESEDYTIKKKNQKGFDKFSQQIFNKFIYNI